MHVCKKCQTKFDDSISFCPVCGTPVSGIYPAHLSQSTKEPVTVGGWIGRSLIPLIPFVGGLVYLIMLFIWSGDTVKEESFRNWAKAQLIVTAVVIVITIILALVAGTLSAELMSSFI